MACGAPANGSLFLPRLLSIVAQGKVITALGREKKKKKKGGNHLPWFCWLCTFLRIPSPSELSGGKMGLEKRILKA